MAARGPMTVSMIIILFAKEEPGLSPIQRSTCWRTLPGIPPRIGWVRVSADVTFAVAYPTSSLSWPNQSMSRNTDRDTPHGILCGNHLKRKALSPPRTPSRLGLGTECRRSVALRSSPNDAHQSCNPCTTAGQHRSRTWGRPLATGIGCSVAGRFLSSMGQLSSPQVGIRSGSFQSRTDVSVHGDTSSQSR